MKKRIFCIALAALMIFSLSACGKKDRDAGTPSVDLEYYAKQGALPECPYTLGTDVETLKTELQAREATEEEIEKGELPIYDLAEGEKSVRIDTGDFLYYYEKDKESEGLSYVVDFGTAYGFEIGTVSLEIQQALAAYGVKETALTEEEVFFLYGVSDATGLRYTFDDVTILFVFQENMLCATALYNTTNWTLTGE
ncbi:MAG: hypothetical protein IJT66_05435 [Clostridia bacterium]|nr:hypothetical protein [Clostridia bacterium]